MPANAQTDAMIARLEAELEERSTFIEGLIAGAQDGNRDLNTQEMELIGTARARITALGEQLTPLRETSRIAIESRNRASEINAEIQGARQRQGVGAVEYRSAGAYVMDVIRAGTGNSQAAERLEVFHRAAAHQTTADNPGLLPEQILGPVVNFIDTARPVVAALGPRNLPSGAWSRPRITQHTLVGAQTAEKTELPSRKLILGKVPVAGDTYGGYVNVSRQNIDWSMPQILDIVINDLTGQYAIETEAACCTQLVTDATDGPDIPANANSQQIATALWSAAGSAFAAMQGQGRLILAVSPDMLGLVGPLFAPVNPQNAQSTGFSAGSFGSGAMGAISGITVVMSAGLPAGTMLVISTAAAEVYEDRVGALQVIEPSVLGTQVAYAGYFSTLVLEPAGVIAIGQAP
jgi:HK97 family phage major capsid protein